MSEHNNVLLSEAKMLSTRLKENLRRTERRTEVQSAKRALFIENGINHQENLDAVQKELEAVIQAASERWNFDFLNDRPIANTSSRFLWEPVQTATDQKRKRATLISGDPFTQPSTSSSSPHPLHRPPQGDEETETEPIKDGNNNIESSSYSSIHNNSNSSGDEEEDGEKREATKDEDRVHDVRPKRT